MSRSAPPSSLPPPLPEDDEPPAPEEDDPTPPELPELAPPAPLDEPDVLPLEVPPLDPLLAGGDDAVEQATRSGSREKSDAIVRGCGMRAFVTRTTGGASAVIGGAMARPKTRWGNCSRDAETVTAGHRRASRAPHVQ
jgi:hypothetical protein